MQVKECGQKVEKKTDMKIYHMHINKRNI